MTSEMVWIYSDLKALYVNCTLKKSPGSAMPEGLSRPQCRVDARPGATVDTIRFVSHDARHHLSRHARPRLAIGRLARRGLAPGGHRGHPRCRRSLWLGDNASITRKFIERLYAMSGMFNELPGQYVFYGKIAGLSSPCEDGAARSDVDPLRPAAHRLRHPSPRRMPLDRRGRSGRATSTRDRGRAEAASPTDTTFMTWDLLPRANAEDAGVIAFDSQRRRWVFLETSGIRKTEPPLGTCYPQDLRP
jgi:hypothetical protein